LADIDNVGLEGRVRLRVRERSDAQAARRGQGREQRDFVVAAHPTGHREMLPLRF
jgi:hypothetical protein